MNPTRITTVLPACQSWVWRDCRVARRLGRRDTGMGLGEMLLVLAGVSVVLGLLAMVSGSVRAENADSQTRQILRTLRMALDTYHDTTSQYPPGPESVAIHHLQTLPETDSMMRTLRFHADKDGFIAINDGFGRAIKYLDPQEAGHRQADFVSAGADGWFGDSQSDQLHHQQAVIDNIFGSDVLTPQP